MEALLDRLNAVQSKILDLYEKAENTLSSQQEHWECIRQEQILYYACRSKGILRLGYQPIPTTSVSQTKAKAAISMCLFLAKLKDSAFASEAWTFAETSQERLAAPPSNCFKKGGYTVEVTFDEEIENKMLYTAWKYIYYLDMCDNWCKSEGMLDINGLYYNDGETKIYYVNFADEAQLYGVRGLWEVHDGNQTLFSSISASTPVDERGDTEPDGPAPTTTGDLSEPSPGSIPGGGSPTDTPVTHTEESIPPGSTPVSCIRCVPPTNTGGTTPQRIPAEAAAKDTRDQAKRKCDQGVVGRPRKYPYTYTGGSPPGRPSNHTRTLGRGSGSVSNFSTQSSVVVPSISGAYPVTVFRGNVNQLKCWRGRIRDKYHMYFKDISTTWKWSGSGAKEGKQCARVTISFHSAVQRERFRCFVPVPPGVTAFNGQFAEL
ncbi:E2 [Trichechus manatus latirostris papillomavirus 1]|uniref:Regulatory protein E2 n=1 Tax=Trichechus manatus papillomavirus 1 TaxID=291589 RepID=Q5UUY2_9PAPI|nr:E2 [Trichechus manatus latirostris papillomavirus 1]AAU11449.1 E2 [Trichechus manatus latirostris papillomavirus 1]